MSGPGRIPRNVHRNVAKTDSDQPAAQSSDKEAKKKVFNASVGERILLQKSRLKQSSGKTRSIQAMPAKMDRLLKSAKKYGVTEETYRKMRRIIKKNFGEGVANAAFREIEYRRTPAQRGPPPCASVIDGVSGIHFFARPSFSSCQRRDTCGARREMSCPLSASSW